MKKKYRAQLALKKAKQKLKQKMILDINYVRVAEAFVKSLDEDSLSKFKLGIIDPPSLGKFMYQLKVSIANRLIKLDPHYKGKDTDQVIESYSDEFIDNLETNVKKYIKQQIQN